MILYQQICATLQTPRWLYCIYSILLKLSIYGNFSLNHKLLNGNSHILFCVHSNEQSSKLTKSLLNFTTLIKINNNKPEL